MKLVGTGFSDVVDLRCAITSLIDAIGERIDSDLRNGVEPRTRFVESPLFRFVSGSFVSRPSTM